VKNPAHLISQNTRILARNPVHPSKGPS
jgi:hypothetical protein